MDEVGHPGPGRVHRPPLKGEPETEHQPGREPQREEEQEWYERGDAGVRMQPQVGAEDGRDRPRGADQHPGGVRRVRLGQREAVRGERAGGQVEEGEAGPAEPFLDSGAEDIEEEQVAQQVQPAGVQEERAEHCERRVLAGGRPGRAAGHRVGGLGELFGGQRAPGQQLGRDGAPALLVPLLRADPVLAAPVQRVEPGGRADQEDQGVERDQRVADGRDGSGRAAGPRTGVVEDRDRHAPKHPSARHGRHRAYGRWATSCPVEGLSADSWRRPRAGVRGPAPGARPGRPIAVTGGRDGCLRQ